MSTILETTVTPNLCIECGICAAACPQGAIRMLQQDGQARQPVVDETLCTRCTQCVSYCPNSWEALLRESKITADHGDWKTFGIDHAALFSAYDSVDDHRLSSASGGVVTVLLAELLQQGKVDLVIHAEMIYGKTGQPHYRACISQTQEEIAMRRSSFYSTFSFDQALAELASRHEPCSVAVVGVPCVVRGLKDLLTRHPKFGHVGEIYTIALACSHNVHPRFTDYLADSLGIDGDTVYKVNLRDKQGIASAGQYNTHFFAAEGTLVKQNRYQTAFTKLWQSYAFSRNVCNACSDFWGYSADLSVKDAWGKKWSSDPKGTCLIAVRSDRLVSLMRSIPTLVLENETPTSCVGSQRATIRYKHKYAKKRLRCKSPAQCNTVSYLHKAHANVSTFSEKQYRIKHGKAFDPAILRHIDQINGSVEQREKLMRLLMLPLKGFQKFGRLTRRICLLPKRVFARLKREKAVRNAARKKRLHQKKILVLGGFGGMNTGDQAQICTTIDKLKRWFPDHMVKVLMANQQVVYQKIGKCSMGDPPRTVFYKIGERITYKAAASEQVAGRVNTIINVLAKISMRMKMRWIFLNARLVRFNLPPFLLSAEAAGLLYDIKTAAMVYFSGSGMFSGKVLSRLWDSLLVCRIAELYAVPVVLSGQTVGDWDTGFNRRFAYKGLKSAAYIMTRDPVVSLKALEEVRIAGPHVNAICDDALFCRKADTERLKQVLADSGCDDTFLECGYVAVNFHFWGAVSSREKQMILQRMHDIIRATMDRYTCGVLLVPMVPSDMTIYNHYLSQFPDVRIKTMRYDYEFLDSRAVIGASKLCVTMKHHPIIFAMGEHVPVISINYSQYYEHKNGGALATMGMDTMKVSIGDNDYLEQFSAHLKKCLENQDEIEKTYQIKEAEIKKKLIMFEHNVKALINQE